jgi:hypothetical protein
VIDLRAVPGVGAEIVLTVDGELRRAAIQVNGPKTQRLGHSRATSQRLTAGVPAGQWRAQAAEAGCHSIVEIKHVQS